MKQRDILALMDGIAPGIAASFAKAIAPVLERLAAAEARLAELFKAAPTPVDIDAIVAAAVERALAGQPKVSDLVAAAVKDLAPAQQTTFALEVDATKIKAIVDEAVSGVTVDFDEIGRLVDERLAKAVDALPKVPTAAEVAALVKAPTAEEVAALVPAGKDADPEAIRSAVAAAVAELPAVPTAAEIAALVPAGPTAEDVAALIPAPTPGKDADPEIVAAMVADEVQRAVAALPPAAPGKDADPEVIKAEVAEAVAALPPAKDGADATPEQIAAAVEKVLATWERPKDGVSVTVEELQPTIEAAVEKAMAARPAPKDGADGVGLAGALIDRDGELALTLTDGRVVKLGRVTGKDGEPGLGFDDLEVVDGSTTVVLRFARGDQVKEFSLTKPTLADCYRGVWRAGAYRKGDAVTWGGSLWLAQADTGARPETDDSWKLTVKRGRDGKDLTPIEPRPPAPVKLK